MNAPPSVAPGADDRAALPPIRARYLLVTFIPSYLDDEGALWLDRLWHQDFVEHLRYLKRVTLAAPVLARRDGPTDLVRVEPPPDAKVSIVALPAMGSTREAVAHTPALARALWRAIADAEIVHSGVVGWPFPPGWVANAIALLRRRPLVLVVESAPWRLHGGPDERPRDRLREAVTEALARFFVRRADLNIFTQPAYQKTLAVDTPGCHIIPATWINEEDVVNREEAEARWAVRRGEPVRLLFAARMLSSKGVDVLLDALRALDRRGVQVRVDMIGEGPRRQACSAASRQLASVDLRVLDPVPYGAPFFQLVRDYHAVLVPNLGDEQPRILFDAYAQAVPVIAFDTDGIRPHVREGETGWRVPRGDVLALARTVERASMAPGELARMGLTALGVAPRFTHRGMHAERWRILLEAVVPREV